jgi:hypothetical protein
VNNFSQTMHLSMPCSTLNTFPILSVVLIRSIPLALPFVSTSHARQACLSFLQLAPPILL